MCSQKLSSIKIPTFDKEHYALRKKKMSLFMKASNPIYPKIIKNGLLFCLRRSQLLHPEQLLLAYYVAKEQSQWTEIERKIVGLDICLQLIINRIHRSNNVWQYR